MTADYYRDAKWPPRGTAGAHHSAVKAKRNLMSAFSTQMFPPVVISCRCSIKHTCEMQLILHRLLVWRVCHACSLRFILLVWSFEHQLQLIPMLWTKTSRCNGSADTHWLTSADLIQYDLLYVCDLDFQNKGWCKDAHVGLVFFYWIVRATAA